LPFNITTPGTYVLAGNLISPVVADGTGVINISTPIKGAVILDLNSFTITGTGGTSFGIVIKNNSLSTYPITIRNGTITGFGYGVYAVGLPAGSMSNITVNKIVFNPSTAVSPGVGSTGLYFTGIDSSAVNNCTFNSGYWGIFDVGSQGGNEYNNLSFVNTIFTFTIQPNNASSNLKHIQFAPPPSN
jgi:hypothetical protein